MARIRPDRRRVDPPDVRGRGFHAEQIFEFTRLPTVGELLTVSLSEGTEWQKEGRGGRLHFRDRLSEYRDASGELVASARWISVAVEPVRPNETPSAEAAGSTSPPGARNDLPDANAPLAGAPSRLRVGEVKPGDRWSEVVVDRLTLAQLVRYAGASGDYIALHHDQNIAAIVGGYGGVFAHGMLTMGASSRIVSTLLGGEGLRRLSSRMLSVVYPGDTLTTTATIESVRPVAGGGTAELVVLRIVTVKQDGQIALIGSATGIVS